MANKKVVIEFITVTTRISLHLPSRKPDSTNKRRKGIKNCTTSSRSISNQPDVHPNKKVLMVAATTNDKTLM